MVERLMACFAAWGYERVKPPLIEFEDALLSGMGAAMASDTFRLMDPVSQRMMGVRADMTPQVGRIAASRLKGSARPLRLSYAGQVLRVKGEQMRPERQIGQAGVELIGIASAAADAEAVLLAAEALQQLGVTQLVVDLNAPTLAVSYLRELRHRRSGADHRRARPQGRRRGEGTGRQARAHPGAADECRRRAAAGAGASRCDHADHGRGRAARPPDRGGEAGAAGRAKRSASMSTRPIIAASSITPASRSRCSGAASPASSGAAAAMSTRRARTRPASRSISIRSPPPCRRRSRRAASCCRAAPRTMPPCACARKAGSPSTRSTTARETRRKRAASAARISGATAPFKCFDRES